MIIYQTLTESKKTNNYSNPFNHKGLNQKFKPMNTEPEIHLKSPYRSSKPIGSNTSFNKNQQEISDYIHIGN